MMLHNTEVFGMTYDAYLLAKGDLDTLIQNSNDSEDDDEFIE